MSDYFFKKYYDSVRDPAWPDVKTLTEFVKLDQSLQTECSDRHGLATRLDQLEDEQYWRNQSWHNKFWMSNNNNVGYVPTYKCAHSHFSRIFERMGWQEKKLSDCDFEHTKLFGLMLNPYVRRLKGITETLLLSYDFNYEVLQQHLQNKMYCKFISQISLTDIHSIPMHMIYGCWFDRINWIPMDLFSPTELCKQVEKLIQQPIPDVPPMHKSTSQQLEIFKMLEKLFLDQPIVPAELGLMFAQDVKSYNRLVEKHKAGQP